MYPSCDRRRRTELAIHPAFLTQEMWRMGCMG